MWTDTLLLSIKQAGIFFNVVGVAVPMVVSLAVVWFYQERYFRYWTTSYVFMFLALVIHLLVVPLNWPMFLVVVGTMSHVVGTFLLFRTGFALRGKLPPPAWEYTAVVAMMGLCGTLLFLGLPVERAITPTLLSNLVGHCLLGWALLSNQAASKIRIGLAWSSIGIGLWGLTYPILAKSGLHWVGFMIIGGLHLFLGIGMALFLLEQSAYRLKLQNAELRQLDQMKNNFISTMSHEFRTPLGAIKSAAWFSTRAEREYLEEMRTIITQSVDKLTDLLDDVLDYSKMEAGMFSFEYATVDLREVGQATIKRLRYGFQEKSLSLMLEAGDDPIEVEGDEARLGQVLSNLLSNALKFTPKGGHVTVRLLKEGGWGSIQIQDTGVGIAPQEQANIFTKFYQVDGSSTRKAGGTGLGLAIARAIVEDGHQGRLEVQSEVGHGSTFTVRLPLTQGSRRSEPVTSEGA